MADNIGAVDYLGTTRTVRTTDTAGVHVPHVNIENIAALTALLDGLEGSVDGLEAALASILAKIIAAPATEAKQDIIIAALASILAKIIAAPATEAKQDTVIASLSVIDDWDESDRAKVNPIVGQAGVAAGAGAVGATTQRATLASDDPAVVALQVIDDWDESDRAKVNPIAGQAGVAAGAGATDALTQRVRLASDETLTSYVKPPGTVAGATIGVASAELLAADAARVIVEVQNVSATAIIAVRSGAAAALNTAANKMAYPLGYAVFEGAAAAAQIFAISDTASTPATVTTG